MLQCAPPKRPALTGSLSGTKKSNSLTSKCLAFELSPRVLSLSDFPSFFWHVFVFFSQGFFFFGSVLISTTYMSREVGLLNFRSVLKRVRLQNTLGSYDSRGHFLSTGPGKGLGVSILGRDRGLVNNCSAAAGRAPVFGWTLLEDTSYLSFRQTLRARQGSARERMFLHAKHVSSGKSICLQFAPTRGGSDVLTCKRCIFCPKNLSSVNLKR